MATKRLWQSVTGWMTKSDDPSAAKQHSEPETLQQSQPAAYPGAPSPGADSTQSSQHARLSPSPLPITPSQPAAPVRAASAEGAQSAADPDPRPDEGPEINRKVIEVIKTCYDPEIPVNIYELGLIYAVNVNEEGHADVTMTLTAPNCPAAQSLPNEVKFKVEAMDEIKSANVEIVFDPPWTPNKMSDAAKLTLNIL